MYIAIFSIIYVILEMLRILTIILLLNGVCAFGQNVRIDTLHLPKGENSAQLPATDLKFPIIKTGNTTVEAMLNKDLKNRFTKNEFPDLPTDSTLLLWADNHIISLDFEVTYRKNGLLSLKISGEWCSAYCTSWTDYFTYSTSTGKYVSIDEIVDTTGKFREIVLADKSRQYEEQRQELKRMQLDKNSEVDEETYNLALEHYNNCDKNFELKTFALYSDHLEIIEKCYLPHYIRNLTPIIELNYKYKAIKKYLKIKN